MVQGRVDVVGDCNSGLVSLDVLVVVGFILSAIVHCELLTHD